MDINIFNLLFYFALIMGVAVGGLTISALVGLRKRGFFKEEPYECGVPQIGETRREFNVRFFMVALIFMLFDIEVLLLAPYAATMIQDAQSGKGLEYGLVAGVFFLVLTLALVYEWGKGVLDWNLPLGAERDVQQVEADTTDESGQDSKKAA